MFVFLVGGVMAALVSGVVLSSVLCVVIMLLALVLCFLNRR